MWMTKKSSKLFYTVIFFSTLFFLSAYNLSEYSSQNASQLSDTHFDMMMSVLTHKRCINCHPSGDRPKQGEDSHIHLFEVARGEDGHGLPAMHCNTCHQEENNDFSGVPGAPHWHLAPRTMAWEGLDKIQIAQSMLDRQKNGGRSAEEIRKHLTEDLLVLWAFDPGKNLLGDDRERPPITKEAYIEAVNAWFENGANIPDQN